MNSGGRVALWSRQQRTEETKGAGDRGQGVCQRQAFSRANLQCCCLFLVETGTWLSSSCEDWNAVVVHSEATIDPYSLIKYKANGRAE